MHYSLTISFQNLYFHLLLPNFKFDTTILFFNIKIIVINLMFLIIQCLHPYYQWPEPLLVLHLYGLNLTEFNVKSALELMPRYWLFKDLLIHQ